METKSIVLLALGTLLVGVVAGRYLAPTKVITEVKTVEVEKKTKEVDTNKTKHTTVKEVIKPDGTKTTETETTEETSQQAKSKETQSIATDSKTETTYRQPRTTVSILAARSSGSITSLEIFYGASVTHNILGPINVGAFGFTNGVVGVSLGLTF